MVAVTPYVSEREHVLVQTRAHTAVLAGAFVLAALSVALLAAAVRAFADGGDPGLVGTLALAASAGLVALTLGRLAVRVWEWDRTVLAVTEEQVLVVRSALRRQTRSVPLRAVERLDVSQTLVGRLLGYGSIMLENGGRRSRLAYVPHPDRVSRLIAAHVRSPEV
jgi:uncharacterized membrane protein YdbT with pleckstrin-like domain